MKKRLLPIVIWSVLLLFNSCEKCYRCHNVCKVCYEKHTDTTLTIIVCSDVFGEEFYQAYLDSLTSPALGWVCADTTNTKNIRFCGTKSGNNTELLNKKAQGYICSPE